MKRCSNSFQWKQWTHTVLQSTRGRQLLVWRVFASWWTYRRFQTAGTSAWPRIKVPQVFLCKKERCLNLVQRCVTIAATPTCSRDTNTPTFFLNIGPAKTGPTGPLAPALIHYHWMAGCWPCGLSEALPVPARSRVIGWVGIFHLSHT